MRFYLKYIDAFCKIIKKIWGTDKQVSAESSDCAWSRTESTHIPPFQHFMGSFSYCLQKLVQLSFQKCNRRQADESREMSSHMFSLRWYKLITNAVCCSCDWRFKECTIGNVCWRGNLFHSAFTHYRSMGKFSRRQIDVIFLIFPRN